MGTLRGAIGPIRDLSNGEKIKIRDWSNTQLVQFETGLNTTVICV